MKSLTLISHRHNNKQKIVAVIPKILGAQVLGESSCH